MKHFGDDIDEKYSKLYSNPPVTIFRDIYIFVDDEGNYYDPVTIFYE